MNTRVLRALGLFALLTAVIIAASGAPARVDLVSSLSIAMAGLAPSLLIVSWADLRARWFLPLASGLLGGFSWDMLAALVVYKVERFQRPFIYPGYVAGAYLFVAMHVATAGWPRS